MPMLSTDWFDRI